MREMTPERRLREIEKIILTTFRKTDGLVDIISSPTQDQLREIIRLCQLPPGTRTVRAWAVMDFKTGLPSKSFEKWPRYHITPLNAKPVGWSWTAKITLELPKMPQRMKKLKAVVDAAHKFNMENTPKAKGKK